MAKKVMLGKHLIDSAEFKKESGDLFVSFNGEKVKVEVLHVFPEKLIVNINGSKKSVYYFSDTKGTHVDIEGRSYFLNPQKKSLGATSAGSDADGQLKSPMPGKIVQVLVTEGQSVSVGDALIVMEAMKMEHTIKANGDSIVDKVFFGAGDLVDGDVELISLRQAEDEKKS